jgi:hypothetical protein
MTAQIVYLYGLLCSGWCVLLCLVDLTYLKSYIFAISDLLLLILSIVEILFSKFI